MRSPIQFGANSPTISTFALGTIGWGTKVTGKDLESLYDAFREAGGNCFDTAHVYAFWMPNGSGASERALGEIVRRRGDRNSVILTTKGGHPAAPPGYPKPQQFLSPEAIAVDLAESLDRLDIETIDLYSLHRDDPRVPVGEIVDSLNEQIVAGRISRIGVSNWTWERIDSGNDYARKSGRQEFVASSPRFSLAASNTFPDPTVPAFGEVDLHWHHLSQLTLLAWSSTANGYFASDGAKGSGGWDNQLSRKRLAAAKAISAEISVTPNQIALAWLLHQDFPVVPILGTTNVEHLTDALTAQQIRLTPEQMNHLSQFAP